MNAPQSDSTTRTVARCHEPCPKAVSGLLTGLECTVEIGPRGHRGDHRTTLKMMDGTKAVAKLVISWPRQRRSR